MLSFFPRGVLDEILNLIESVSEGFPSYSSIYLYVLTKIDTAVGSIFRRGNRTEVVDIFRTAFRSSLLPERETF